MTNWRDAVERYQIWRREALTLSATAQKRAASLLNAYAQALLSATGGATNARGPAVVDAAQRDAIIADLDVRLAQLVQSSGRLYQATQAASLAHTIAMREVYRTGGSALLRRFDASARALVTSERETFRVGFANWTDRFGAAGQSLKTGMTQDLVNAQVYGWDQRQLAEAFLRRPDFSFKNLPKIGPNGKRIFTMGKALGESDALVRRAHGIAATESTGIRTRQTRLYAVEAGLDWVINWNDVPVHADCIAATAAGPMPWDEMIRQFGLPPRHPNCDSDLMPCTREEGKDAWREVQATLELEPVEA